VSKWRTCGRDRPEVFSYQLMTTLTRNPPDTHSRNRTHLHLCCLFSNSLQCGAPCDVSILLAVYKLLTSYGTHRFNVTVRMLTTVRCRNLFIIMKFGLDLDLYLSYIHTLLLLTPHCRSSNIIIRADFNITNPAFCTSKISGMNIP
jgi:hypothetical protein